MIDKNLPSRNSQQGRAPPLPRNNRRSDDQDGWSHVKTSAQRVDPTKLKLASQKMVGGDKELQLGPAKGFGDWSRGSSDSCKRNLPQQEEMSTVSSTRFSAFADRETRDNRSHSGNRMLSSSSGTKSRGCGGPEGQRMSTPRGSMEKEKNSAVEIARQLSREPRPNSRENSVEGRNMRTPTPTGVVVSRSSAQSTLTAVKQMKRNDWDTKMKSIIDEYLHNNHIKEVLDIVREELTGQNEMMLMTECAINHTLERSTQARRGTGLMLAELLKHKLLPLDTHIKGLGAVLEFADDLAIDIPNVWHYFGELIAPMFTTASVPLDRLVFVCNPLMSIGKASLLAAAVLKEASHNIGHVEIGKRWAESKLDWSKFLTEGEDRDEFIQSNKLEYTLSTQAQSSTEFLPSDVAAQLNKFMLEGVENESVFDWIDSELSPDMCDDNVFIGSLTTSVVQSCISNGSLNESKFKSRIPLLSKYYDGKANRELAALSALENLVAKLQHPANLFSDLCYAVSENDLITDESFLNWEKSSQTGIAVKSVSKFLQWLKEGLTIEPNPTHYLEMFPGGQTTTSVPGFHQQYYVMSPHSTPVAGQFLPTSAMATQSRMTQVQPSARPASNPSISATVPPNNMMSSNSSPQQIAQNSTRMPTQTPAKPDITIQFKGQVAQVASLSSSSVSSVSESTTPILSSIIPSGSAEQTTRHPDKEASVKAVTAPSTPGLIKSEQFDERQFVNSVAASIDFTDIAATETSHKIYDREKKFLSIVTEEQESQGRCHQQESAVTGSSVTSYLPGAAGNVSDCRDSRLNLASEYNGREDQVGGAYAGLGGARTVAPPITESKSAIDKYLDNIDFKVSASSSRGIDRVPS
ncbi:eukaryotic translation initiation factor 4 gamma 3-like [Watersipora subatra]|uniref:eukaryotic translation initiation factor 4 gamma 3-like n=1 Tax=Watersipora subatra TaxID=2589382 RepID=UPI00355AD7C8